MEELLLGDTEDNVLWNLVLNFILSFVLRFSEYNVYFF